MKCVTPEIFWHGRDPIYSIDFQFGNGEIKRLASAGLDKDIKMWLISIESDGSASPEFVSSLTRHSRAVNIVRFSPTGDILASGDDEAIIYLWKLNDRPFNPCDNLREDEESFKEHWTVIKTLRGHIEDVYDLSWSPDEQFLVSGSVDKSAIMWNVNKGSPIVILKEHGGFVQGVAWDPKNQFLATLSSDRSCRIYNINSKRCIHNISKITLPNIDPEAKCKSSRLFHDDANLKSFFRRLTFSPDGEILITPSGGIEQGEHILSTTYIFTRNAFAKPAIYLPSMDKATIAVKCCPILFELRKTPVKIDKTAEANLLPVEENQPSLLNLPYRIVFAVAREDSVLLYDTQQNLPFSYISGIHYHTLSDISWSNDGKILVIASTDGYCSFVTFPPGELGKEYKALAIKSPATSEIKIEVTSSCIMGEGSSSSDTNKNLGSINKSMTVLKLDRKSSLENKPKTPTIMQTLLHPKSNINSASSSSTTSSTLLIRNPIASSTSSTKCKQGPSPRRIALTTISLPNSNSLNAATKVQPPASGDHSHPESTSTTTLVLDIPNQIVEVDQKIDNNNIEGQKITKEIDHKNSMDISRPDVHKIVEIINMDDIDQNITRNIQNRNIEQKTAMDIPNQDIDIVHKITTEIKSHDSEQESPKMKIHKESEKMEIDHESSKIETDINQETDCNANSMLFSELSSPPIDLNLVIETSSETTL